MRTTGTGRRRNRSWPEALKREIVAASLAAGSSVSVVARRYDVNANHVFSWRKLYRDSPLAPAIPAPCPYRKSDPNVLVMQSAEMRLCEDPANALNFARNWSVLV